MKRAPFFLLMLIAHAGCGIGVDSPDVHVRDATKIPIDATQMKEAFRLPDDLTDVYYFSPNSLFCNYYLRGRLSSDAVQAYETEVLKNAVKISDKPLGIFGPETAPISDWWPPSNSQSLQVYKLRDIDYVMIDREKGFVYAVLCSG